jgi:glucose-1-phosphate thymidylyltransferase
MKGVILAGGHGTRLDPLTRVTNKHLLPVYDRPMIYFPIQCLLNAGIDQILIVTGGEHAGDFLKLLGNGKRLGIRELHYTYQQGAGGIADALRLAEDFAENGKICVVLGDNIVEETIRRPVNDFIAQHSGAKMLLKEVDDPERFGVARIEEGRLVEIIEKPARPPSRFAITGIYMYDPDVFHIVRTLRPSARGELEITDVNNAYLARGDLTYDILEGWWSDSGTFESLRRASCLVARNGANRIRSNTAAGAPRVSVTARERLMASRNGPGRYP